jgi:hypothetical protein
MSYATAVTWLFSKFRFPTGFEHSPPLTLLYLKRLHRRSHLPPGNAIGTVLVLLFGTSTLRPELPYSY